MYKRMKNHFVFAYPGNKRDEIKHFLPYINLDGKKTIIEPFCGSSSMSYYISTLYPNKFKYILNDNDIFLIQLYKTMMDAELTNNFNIKMNEYIDEFNRYENDAERKVYYLSICKETNLVSNIFKRKYYNLREGMYPLMNRIKKIKKFDLRDYPIYDFLNKEQVEIKNDEALEIIVQYKNNPEVIFLIDPPYIASCNDFYECRSINVYEYVFNNDLSNVKSSFYFILEDIWLIKVIFQHYKALHKYLKKYEVSKRTTSHILLSNK